MEDIEKQRSNNSKRRREKILEYEALLNLDKFIKKIRLHRKQ